MARVFGLFIFIALLAAGWTGAWKWGAQALEQGVANASQRLVAQGGKLECARQRIEGFPFRIGIFCDRLDFASANGLAISAAAFRSAAQFYKPGHIVGELDGPAALQLPNGTRFELDWQLLRASAKAILSGLSSAALVVDGAVLSEGRGTEGAQTLALSQHLEIHARLTPERDEALDLAISAQAMRDEMQRFPQFTLAGDLMLENMAKVLAGNGLSMPGLIAGVKQDGLSGIVRNLVIEPEQGGRLELSGPLGFTGDGLLEGEIKLSADELPALAQFLVAMLPDQSEIINNIAALLASLEPDQALPGEIAGQGEMAGKRSIVLTIKRGRLSLGFIELVQIPPLF